MVAIANLSGGLVNEDGLDVATLFRIHEEDGALDVEEADVAGERCEASEVLAADVDVLVPASIENVVDGDTAEEVSARLVVEAANLPTTRSGAAILEERGIPVVPDVLANAGGVTVSYLEWVQNRQRYRWPEQRVNDELREILETAWKTVSGRARRDGVSLRVAAYSVAVERVREAIERRGF